MNELHQRHQENEEEISDQIKDTRLLSRTITFNALEEI